MFQSLDGFAFILGNDGRFLYISETVSIYLGLSQVSANRDCHCCFSLVACWLVLHVQRLRETGVREREKRTERERERERQTDRQTDRQREREREREKKREREGGREKKKRERERERERQTDR